MANDSFRIEWDLHELGPKPAPQADALPQPVYRDISTMLDFSRLDYGRAVAAGYVPAGQFVAANGHRFDDEAA